MNRQLRMISIYSTVWCCIETCIHKQWKHEHSEWTYFRHIFQTDVELRWSRKSFLQQEKEKKSRILEVEKRKWSYVKGKNWTENVEKRNDQRQNVRRRLWLLEGPWQQPTLGTRGFYLRLRLVNWRKEGKIKTCETWKEKWLRS